jgi:hypothetical protein
LPSDHFPGDPIAIYEEAAGFCLGAIDFGKQVQSGIPNAEARIYRCKSETINATTGKNRASRTTQTAINLALDRKTVYCKSETTNALTP